MRRSFVIFGLSVLLNFSHVHSNDNLDALINKAIHAIYDEDWATGMVSIDAISSILPNSPVPYFYRGNLYFRKLYSTLDPVYKDSARINFQMAYELSAKLYDLDESNLQMKFYYGGSSGYLGMYYAHERKFFSAAKYGVKGVKILKELGEQDTSKKDVFLGIGIYTYSAGKAPGFLRWLINIWGVETDVQSGLRYLERAAAEGSYAKYEAMDKLVSFYIAEENFVKAGSYLDKLKSDFPNGSWFNFVDVLLAYKAEKWTDVSPRAEKYISLPNASVRYIRKVRVYQIEALYKLTHYEQAIAAYENVFSSLEVIEDPRSFAMAEYFVGRAYEATGRVELARDHFLKYLSIVEQADLSKNEEYAYAHKRIR
jgi:tetratricopeptide (TPR) repeat protein